MDRGLISNGCTEFHFRNVWWQLHLRALQLHVTMRIFCHYPAVVQQSTNMQIKISRSTFHFAFRSGLNSLAFTCWSFWTTSYFIFYDIIVCFNQFSMDHWIQARSSHVQLMWPAAESELGRASIDPLHLRTQKSLITNRGGRWRCPASTYTEIEGTGTAIISGNQMKSAWPN